MPASSLFIIYCVDKPGTAALRSEHLPDHRTHLVGSGMHIVLAGPLQTEARDRSIGSLIIVEAGSRQEVEAFNAADPFFLRGLWESVEIRPFEITRHTLGICLDPLPAEAVPVVEIRSACASRTLKGEEHEHQSS
jgi:uncharacterized protein